MKTYRIGVIGLGQRIAHVLAAMQEVGWRLELAVGQKKSLEANYVIRIPKAHELLGGNRREA